MDEDSAEICRVCRSGATPDQPLFHPCKCSGSIRYVHQDCLTEWLSHSRKQYCELCEHPFSFTPVYSADMPETLPTILFVRQLRKRIFSAICIAARAILVSTVWLVILPYFTVWIWRFYFWSAENLSQYLSRLRQFNTLQQHSNYSSQSLLEPTSVYPEALPASSLALVSATTANETPSPTPFTTSFNNDAINANGLLPALYFKILEKCALISTRISVKQFLSDCFEGQVITCIVAIALVAAFLLREWIIQNIPAELELDEQGEEEAPVIHADLPPVPEEGNNETVEAGQDTHIDHTQQEWIHYENRVLDAHTEEEDHLQNTPLERNHDDSEWTSEDEETENDAIARPGQPPNAPLMGRTDRVLLPEPMPVENHAANPQPLPPPPPPPAFEDGAENENDEENIGDDLDGVLEVIGMRGDLLLLASNSVLFCLLVALCLGAAVWMPYIIGIVFILSRPFDLLRLPFEKVVSLIDATLDLTLNMCSTYVFPRIEMLYHACIANYVAVPENMKTALSSPSQQHLETGKDFISHVDQLLQGYIRDLQLAYVNKVQPLHQLALTRYQQLAFGRSGLDRFLCITIGYIVLIMLSSWFVSRARTAYATFGRTVKQAIQQQGIILKVGMFVAIELFLFPLACGVLLDLASLSAFQNTTINDQIEYFRSHPAASVFMHWFFGTAFMFVFAILVTICRDIVRPGVMWFIRDPNDPQFHPIKEIVERPVLTQLQKIGASAILYAVVIVAGIGGITWCLQHLATGVLPLRWRFHSPLSTIPIDFLFVHIAIPTLADYFKPSKAIKKLALCWMKILSRKLRLTSYLFGGRHNEEEMSQIYRNWKIRLYALFSNNLREGEDMIYQQDGQLVRAPKHDSVPFVPGRRMLVPVDPITHEILDPEERRLGHPATSNPGDDVTNTTIVYTPPHFKQRIMVFLLLMWVSFSLVVSGTIAAPILVGRAIFRLVFPTKLQVHDMYSFLIGGLSLLLTAHAVIQCYLVLKDVRSQPSAATKVSQLRMHLSSLLDWVGRIVYVLTMFGMAMPLLYGLTAELYFVLPNRKLGENAPTIQLAPIWAQGCALMSITQGLARMAPNNTWLTWLSPIPLAEIRNVNLWQTTTKRVLPVFSILLGAIVIPLVIAILNIRWLGSPALQIKIFQTVYPAFSFAISTLLIFKYSAKIGRRWAQSVREDNYLVGRSLHNYEENGQ